MAGYIEIKNLVEREIKAFDKALVRNGSYRNARSMRVVVRQQIQRADEYYKMSTGPIARPARAHYLERAKNHLGMVQNIVGDYRRSLPSKEVPFHG